MVLMILRGRYAILRLTPRNNCRKQIADARLPFLRRKFPRKKFEK